LGAWGIGDDFERDRRVLSAAVWELRALVEAVDGVDDQALYGWLSGPASFSDDPTPEYLAVTNLTMAADYARVLLEQRKK
jgi:hypothetical protein